ncbi:MAG: dihydroneopterin aldolase [Candidatus Lambdaproteobacteria bacterium]|nr:dihydroneopterin aldolase [Candidatus Lambdaproteobacteria bacterium]
MTAYRFEAETIHLHDLRVECIIGVNPAERETPQPLLISLSFPRDFAQAARRDALEHTIDYAEVARAAREFAGAGRYLLLETLARRLGEHLCTRFALDALSLHIRKPAAVAGSAGPAVSLTIHRVEPAAEGRSP